MTNREEIINIYRQHNEYMVDGNIVKLGNLLDDNFYLAHMSGMKQNKVKWLDEIETGGMNYYSSTEEHVDIIELTHNSAVLVGQSRVDADIHGLRNTWSLELTLHLEKNVDQWKILYITAKPY
ncbi:nuclear transport factor 2 family protein [Paucilactobacillus suebicus]|nr:nuclear transport factor 2 family protein [Paucilactobacillus suebicus]